MKHVIRTTALVVLASLAMMATANDKNKHKQTKKPKAQPSQKLSLNPPASGLGSMIGTWTLRDGDKPRTDIKMKFKADGTFAFLGPNWQSAGKFRVEEHKLRLEWTSVDGQKVAPGQMKKDFSMAEDDSSFTIDKYTYYKLPKS